MNDESLFFLFNDLLVHLPLLLMFPLLPLPLMFRLLPFLLMLLRFLMRLLE